VTNGEHLYAFSRQNQPFSRKWWNLNDQSSYLQSIFKYNLLGLHSRKGHDLCIIKQKIFLLALLVKSKFNEISWIKENVKTLGVPHGYNVDNDVILYIHSVHKHRGNSFKLQNYNTKDVSTERSSLLESCVSSANINFLHISLM
jgi:hypothetical protein